jgi:signal peptidase II
MFAMAVPMITSGALGNLVDRLRYGYVIDFIRYHGLFEWPTFNVADMAVSVGAFLLAWVLWGEERPTTTTAATPQTAREGAKV